jgi:DNA-binding transcriptional LysR family regulator
MDWDKLRIFHAVADAGSLTHAGETLHLSQSAVSRQIRALELSLNTTLFRRHARGLIPHPSITGGTRVRPENKK